MKMHGQQQGFTLIEMLVVIAIMGIVLSYAIIQSRSVEGKQNVENELKTLQSTVMGARVRAMARSRIHFVRYVDDAVETIYGVYEDTNESGTWEKTDAVVSIQGLHKRFPRVWGAANPLLITEKGVIDTADVGTVRIVMPAGESGTVDCLVITEVKVRLGRWISDECMFQ